MRELDALTFHSLADGIMTAFLTAPSAIDTRPWGRPPDASYNTSPSNYHSSESSGYFALANEGYVSMRSCTFLVMVELLLPLQHL